MGGKVVAGNKWEVGGDKQMILYKLIFEYYIMKFQKCYCNGSPTCDVCDGIGFIWEEYENQTINHSNKANNCKNASSINQINSKGIRFMALAKKLKVSRQLLAEELEKAGMKTSEIFPSALIPLEFVLKACDNIISNKLRLLKSFL
jgi:hypothetical protein